MGCSGEKETHFRDVKGNGDERQFKYSSRGPTGSWKRKRLGFHDDMSETRANYLDD